jgi:hypothetical protein
MADEQHEPGHGEEIHLPSPSYQPLIAALGVSMLLAGLISESFLWRTGIMSVGFSVGAIGIWLWVKDAIDEYRSLPD